MNQADDCEVALHQVELDFRSAREEDLPNIVGLLASDPLGSQREQFADPLPGSYVTAFKIIADDPNQDLIVATLQGSVVGVLQLTFIPHLTYRGGWRAQIEGVRVAESVRAKGVGRAMIERALTKARDRKCHLVQLTTDARRPEALKFYESLGFAATHHGLKLHLDLGAD